MDLKKLNDLELQKLLDDVTLEIKRRAGIEGTALSHFNNKKIEENVREVLETMVKFGLMNRDGGKNGAK